MSQHVPKVNRNRKIILDRREHVKKLKYLEHKTMREIAEIVGWNERTIKRDIQAIRQEMDNDVNRLNLNDLSNQRKLAFERNVKLLKELYKEDFHPGEQRRILQALKNEETALIKDMQELSKISKPTERLEVDHQQRVQIEIIMPEDGKHIKDTMEADFETISSTKDSNGQ